MNKTPSVQGKSRVFWTLSRKITLLVFIVASIIFVAFVQMANKKMRASLETLAIESYTSTTQLLTDTVAPAIRWKKAGKIQEHFKHLTAPEDSALSGLYSFGLPGKDQFSVLLSANESEHNELQRLVAPYAYELQTQTKVVHNPHSLIIVMPIFNPKNGEQIGGVASIWNIKPIQETVNANTIHLIEIALIFIVLLAILLGIVIRQSVGTRIRAAVKVANEIAQGNLDTNIVIKSNDELGQLASALKGVQISLKASDDSEKRAQESGRIKRALDCASSCTLLADQNAKIVYVNQSAQLLFSEDNDVIQKLVDSRKLNNGSLIDVSLDIFTRYSQLTPKNINNRHKSGEVRINEDGLSLVVRLSPVVDKLGLRTGTVLEWYDRTHEVTAEHELQQSVDAAASGDFSRRINTGEMTGFHAHVATMLNNMAEITESGMNDTLRVLQSLATGDLNARIGGKHEGVFAELRDNSNATTDKLKTIVSEIRHAAVEVNQGAGSIAQGNQALSTRTEQQAARLEETAAAMQELTVTVQQNTENVIHASKLASSTREEAIHGGDVADRAVSAVIEISEASKKIADIISVIDEIAFQTNLLALNASVEAARAGEKGRGFAVVASEVRDLAGRSAAAAKEIKELIGDSVAKVDEGEKLVSESGDALKAIVESVRKVSEIVSEISCAGEEQIQGIDQINNAIMQIDEMTQKNAAMVGRQASASQQVGELAQHLDKMVRYFDIDGNNQQTDTSNGSTQNPKRAA